MPWYHDTMGVQGPKQGAYDVMQVCRNGHLITAYLSTMPETGKRFCTACGQETLDRCTECQALIRGPRTDFPELSPKAPPNNCHECGTAYPWRQAAIANAIEVAQAEVDAANAEEVAQLVRSIAESSPRTEADALKLREMLKRAGGVGGDVLRKVFADVASEIALKAMGFR